MEFVNLNMLLSSEEPCLPLFLFLVLFLSLLPTGFWESRVRVGFLRSPSILVNRLSVSLFPSLSTACFLK